MLRILKIFILTLAAICFLADLNPLFAAAEEEKITILTYYPIPSGSYNQLTTSGSTYMATGASARVGIGTTAPVGLLQVGTSPSPGLLVTPIGNVGIGTTDPGSYRLYVDGDPIVYGNIFCNGTGNPQMGFNGTIGFLTIRGGDINRCDLIIEGGVVESYNGTC